jgi:hypothetical protein
MLTKADLLFVARERNIHCTKNISVEILRKMLNPISNEEHELIKKQYLRRKSYNGNITYNSGIYGIPLSYTKDTKIDILLELPIHYPIILNEEQIFVSKYLNEKEIFVNAGPGSGKTATSVELVKHINNYNKRILVLMYGTNVEKQFKKKLISLGLKIQSKNKLINNVEGIYVVTFHKYAYNTRLQGYSVQQFSSHDIMIDKAIKIKSNDKWDYLIVDEAQDIKEPYYKLIQTINYEHIIYMGDARQQINPGANVYSSIVKTPLKLLNNHRSTPEIVNLLNLYSKNNFFTEIDIQQIPILKNTENSVIIVKGNESSLVAKYIAEYSVGSTYAISPVSVDKYDLQNTVNDIRQCLYSGYNRKITIAESGRELNTTKDYISTSIFLKGLERKQVVLFGVSNTKLFVDYTVPEYQLKCLIYVAMSRAMQRLVIVIDENKYYSPNLLDCCLTNIKLESCRYTGKRSDNIPSISVTDLSEYTFSNSCNTIKTLDGVAFDRNDIEDCCGYFVEAKCANKLGVLFNKYVYSYTKNKESIYANDDSYKCEIKAKGLDSIFEDINTNNDTNEYKYVRAMYVCKIKKDWTVSNSLKNVNVDVDEYVNFIKLLLGNGIKHSERIIYKVPIDRSSKIAGKIHGTFDLSSNNAIIEMKHAHNNTKHLHQSCIYSYISNRPVYLCNTLNGTISSVTYNGSSFDQYVRAILILREAHLNRISNSMKLPSGIIVVIDTEFWEGIVYEIGAVAIDTINMTVIGTFQKLYECIESNEEHPFTKITGLKITGRPKNYNDFHKWIKLYDNPVIVQWSGNDAQMLGLKYYKNIDLSCYYRTYISRKGYNSIKSGWRLCDAVNEIFPPGIPWEAHRAFEDAVMTMGIFYALSTER